MNSGRSDASTSTDDVNNRPLCLFYFTHPFGVLSPEPPTLAAAPAHIARAFVNMEPVSPFTLWGTPSDDSYNTSYNTATSSSRPSFELGDAKVHPVPKDLISVARTRKCTLDFGAARRDSISSSLFSSDMWFNSSSSCKSTEYPRRLIPYNKILPPLRLPSPLDSSNVDSSEDLWPKKCLNPEKFSLPPIELPAVKLKIVRNKKCVRSGAAEEPWSGDGAAGRDVRARRRLGVSKPRRPARHADLRRLLAMLMRRAIAEGATVGGGVSPALRDALNTIREAWAEPSSLRARCGAIPGTGVTVEYPPRAPHMRDAMERAPLTEHTHPGASPGLLRRRYSVPETIMRKYRLAQQRSDLEESVPATSRSAASASPVSGDPHRFARRDRELMRKSALLRRMWGRNDCRGCCCCADEPAPECGRETRSLDGSRSELRHLSSGLTSSRYSHAVAGWATPKRQRLDSRDFRGSDEMLRAAMRNSYDRAEESRDRAARADLSDCTFRSHAHHPDSYVETVTDPFTDSDVSKFDGRPARDAYTQYSDRQSSDSATAEIKSDGDERGAPEDLSSPQERVHCALSDSRSLSDTSESFSTSLCTAKEMMPRSRPVDVTSKGMHFNGRISEHSSTAENDDCSSVLPYDKPLTIETTPSYEVLEIVVSETLNANPVPAIHAPATPDKFAANTLRAPPLSQRNSQNINIDEYVSNILVESLNSLTDQLECMNASIGSDRKISIVEKEIKVKLQNTGVNTIVHLSPTSNNQIIFGNEELCNDEGRRDTCNNNALTIREEAHSVESNNNETSVEPPIDPESLARCSCESFDIHHDNVNQAVLQQIQKLFQDELQNLAPGDYPSAVNMPEISHIEISDVDVFIDNAEAALAAQEAAHSPTDARCPYEVIGGIGAGNYYPNVSDNPVVPRFSALPHTDSMEVNTSSSDDADLIGSDCTSLVDSLDDPNSPRSVLLRRAYNTRRSELVRSAIDVLDLLPENVRNDETPQPRDKPESFFIGIKDECDCDKENINVADRMPEKIKQRLYRRHRKRELRMECARRSRTRQQRREMERDRVKHADTCRSRRDVERDCIAIVNALIDDVIAKIAQDEYKCMRIKHRPTKMLTSKSDENVAKRTWRKELDPIDDREPFKAIKNGSVRFDTKDRSERHHIHGKLSLRPPPTTDDRAAKRIYQKSEIHEGNKCIEILEILEYVNGSQSSPETTNSDENQNHCSKNKKSRIPVPIHERSQRSPSSDSQRNNNRRSSGSSGRGVESNENTNRMIADMLLEALADHERSPPPPRRASVPAAHEPRERANSLRFRQVFDIIPEERSSLSLDSGAEDLSHNRRASAPDIVDEYREPSERDCDDAPPPPAPLRAERRSGDGNKHRHSQPLPSEMLRRYKDTKSAATSPMSDDAEKRTVRSKHQTTMTSPCSKSAATSPLRAASSSESGAGGGGAAGARRGLASRGRAWLGLPRGDARLSEEGAKEKAADPDKMRARRSSTTQYDVRRTLRAQTERNEHSERHERAERATRANRTTRSRAAPPRRTPLARSQSCERVSSQATDAEQQAHSPNDSRNETYKTIDKRKSRTFSLERNEEETVRSVKLPEFKGGGSGDGGAAGTSSDSSESGGSLLCSLAPRWLAPARAHRAARRRDTAPDTRPPRADSEAVAPDATTAAGTAAPSTDTTGGWSVTVAGSCRAALPADVEMRLRFPHERDAPPPAPLPCQDCTCRHCAACVCSARSSRAPRPPLPSAPPLPAAPPPPQHARLSRTDSKLTLTMKKEALDSSILASKSSRKSSELPDVETYRASRSKLKSSVKTRRGYSLHCWLPDNEDAPIRARNGLSVLGCAIIPELKPRVPTMSERDLTRVYTPRHYLRS